MSSSGNSSAESDAQLTNNNTKTELTTAAAAASSASSSSTAEATSATAPTPKDKVNLRLLLTNGKRADFLFSPDATVEQIKQQIFDNWPAGWAEEKVGKVDEIRLLYHGKFLDNIDTLEGRRIPAGQTTTMHMVPKSKGNGGRDSGGGCRCICL